MNVIISQQAAENERSSRVSGIQPPRSKLARGELNVVISQQAAEN